MKTEERGFFSILKKAAEPGINKKKYSIQTLVR
jgi:hypothetical protein